MDKYTLLLLLNAPFVIFGIIKSIITYRKDDLTRIGFLIRLLFWSAILYCLVFAEQIYNYLSKNSLTDSGPLSLPDVVLVTGVIFSLFLCLRLYSKNESLERRLSDLHERVSISMSEPEE